MNLAFAEETEKKTDFYPFLQQAPWAPPSYLLSPTCYWEQKGGGLCNKPDKLRGSHGGSDKLSN